MGEAIVSRRGGGTELHGGTNAYGTGSDKKRDILAKYGVWTTFLTLPRNYKKYVVLINPSPTNFYNEILLAKIGEEVSVTWPSVEGMNHVLRLFDNGSNICIQVTAANSTNPTGFNIHPETRYFVGN